MKIQDTGSLSTRIQGIKHVPYMCLNSMFGSRPVGHQLIGSTMLNITDIIQQLVSENQLQTIHDPADAVSTDYGTCQ